MPASLLKIQFTESDKVLLSKAVSHIKPEFHQANNCHNPYVHKDYGDALSPRIVTQQPRTGRRCRIESGEESSAGGNVAQA